MTKINFLSKVSMRVWSMIAVAVAVVVVPAGLLAWGPDRPTYTMESPADHVTFNSITNNPNHGDERNFVQIRDLTAGTDYDENVNLIPGHKYEVYTYYHNDAASNLNGEDFTGKGVAHGAYIKTELPAVVNAGEKARINSYVGASNASPKEVWDEAFAKNDTQGAMALRIVPGSAKITSNGAVNGKTLPDSFYSAGTPLGYDKLDGNLPGCGEYSGYVVYQFQADQPNFTISKTVSLHDKNKFEESVDANAGDLVDFLIMYKNTGTTQQDGVVIKDSLPKNLSYVADTTFVSNSSTGNKFKAITANTVAEQGVDIGSYAPGGAGFVKFTAKVASQDALECGTNKLTNTAEANTQNGSLDDTATVVVKKDCVEPPVEEKPKEVKACNLDTKQIENVDENKVDDINFSSDLSLCATEVTELPHTGLSDNLLGLFGAGTLTAMTLAYVTSRRS